VANSSSIEYVLFPSLFLQVVKSANVLIGIPRRAAEDDEYKGVCGKLVAICCAVSEICI
jgi:hypothetical protein